jgi:putative transposase
VLEECRWLYNTFLAERKAFWEQEQKSIGWYQQKREIVVLREERLTLGLVHSQVLQDVSSRVDLAFKAFFRRVKAGEKPGYPRFKGSGQYHSFTYPQNNGSFKVLEGGLVRLSKVGDVKIKYHRPFEGTLKTCTVSRTQTGKWFVSFSCEVEPSPLPFSEFEVGVDMGLTTFATFSDGSTIQNPRFFKREQKALARAQRSKRKKVVARVHERVTNKRKDFAHKKAKRVVAKYGTICAEDLNIKNMLVRGSFPHLSKSIADAAWGSFLACVAYKAENAGRVFKQVNPAYTSQDCSACGARTPMPLSERTYRCAECGLGLDRDLNAAKNILRVGLYSLSASS